MNRLDFIESLRDARAAHQKWIGYGEKLLDGIDLQYVQAPLSSSECAFGRWFYKERDQIKHIQGFRDIEKLHEQFHRIYESLYFNAPKVHKSKGVFSSKRKQIEQSRKHAECFKQLQKMSYRLQNKLEQVEKTVLLMSDRLFMRNCRLPSTPVVSNDNINTEACKAS